MVEFGQEATLSAEEQRVITMLHSSDYETTARATGWSRGRIYALALRIGARKTEERIRERAADRERRQRETLAALFNKTAKADVLDYLTSLPDESVNLIATSPPYNIGRGYGSAAGADSMRPLRYFGWLCEIISEMERVIAPGGTIAMVVGATYRDGGLWPIDWLVSRAFDETSLSFQSRVMWPCAHGLPPSKARLALAPRHEAITIFSKGKPAFNPNAARRPQKHPGKRAFHGPNRGRLSGHPLGGWPTDVWDDIGHLGHNHSEKTAHPAQFPVAIPKRLIALFTRPGDLVCDPFSGSGSTHVAAIETGPNFTGADLFYSKLRDARVDGAVPDRFSPLAGVTPESIAIWQAEAVRRDAVAEPITDARDAELVLSLFGDGQCA